MERTYLPFAAHILFPRKKDVDSFCRFSRVNNLDCILEIPQQSIFLKFFRRIYSYVLFSLDL